MKARYVRSGLSAGVFFGLLLMQSHASAEQIAEFGNYVVQYNALTTDQVPENVAETYKIKRSRNYVLLNVMVQEKSAASAPRAVDAEVTASATNLWGQVKRIPMRPIREDDVVYYIGEAKVVNEEILNFDIDIKPDKATSTHNLRFQQQFFVR